MPVRGTAGIASRNPPAGSRPVFTASLLQTIFAAIFVVGGEAKQYRKSSVISRTESTHPICALPTTSIHSH
ncbi:uncharacterized protein N7500_009838 [Penicillium coprophilum]|uniref:uncharacterized protein n=1 Tax=Penicillium coprophilum TaxID=36646 RepID=UPI0023844663|nr:uncharacterized protein N7500_009838 [Penicillium coprophilum]KAJ5154399.1 hypothetical protein N7500_009838 [Penicillium coprophilum]